MPLSRTHWILSVVGVWMTACGGPPQAVLATNGVPDSAPVRLSVPRQSVYLRASFDQDPSGVLGQFVPNGTPPDQLDENVAARTRCSVFLKVTKVAASGSFDESLNASQGVSGSLGFQPVPNAPGGGVEAAYGRGSAMRVRYTLSEKMRAEIADPEGFDQCCRAAPDQCADTFIGEMFRGTGEVFQFAGTEAGFKAGGTHAQGVEGAVDFKSGAAWQRVSRFEDSYFAFRTQAARLGAKTTVEAAESESSCGWAEKVPTSLDGQYFVGLSALAGSESGARELALRDAQVQAVKYLGESVSTSTTAKGSALEGFLKDATLLQTAASGLTRRVKAERWCKADQHESPDGLKYVSKVLVFFPKTRSRPQRATPPRRSSRSSRRTANSPRRTRRPSMRRAVRAEAALALMLLACGGANPTPGRAAPVSATPVSALPPPHVSAPPAPDEPKCTNRNLVPPDGYLQETRFGDAQELDAVGQRALSALREKVCGDACATLDAAFSLWRVGADPDRTCAMAVVSKEKVEAWTRAAISAETLDANLAEAAKALVTRGVRVQVARIDDAGAPGGERVRWLLPRLARALEAAGASPVEAPARGHVKPGLPPGVTHEVVGTLTARLEQRTPVLELATQARVHEEGVVRVLSAQPVVFAAAIAPWTAGRLPDAPPSDPGLDLRLDQSPDGLCGGDRTQLWLTVDAPLEVRVFDLYGDAGALLVFAGRVEPGGRRPLGGPEGFAAVPVPGHEAERFLVVAAPTAAALGDLAGYTQVCRLPTDRARALHAFQQLPPGARLAHDAFRITNAPPCAPLDPKQSRAALALLEEVPRCR